MSSMANPLSPSDQAGGGVELTCWDYSCNSSGPFSEVSGANNRVTESTPKPKLSLPCNARPHASQNILLNLPRRGLGKRGDKLELAGHLEMRKNTAREIPEL